MIVDVSKSSVILSSAPVIKLLKSKEASGVIDIKVKMSLLNKQYIYSLYKSMMVFKLKSITLKLIL